MSETNAETGTGGVDREPAPEEPPVAPELDDEYLEAVSRRLQYNYDLETEYALEGVSVELYGRMELHNQKHFFHPAISFAHHETHEHLFVRRVDGVTDTDLEWALEVGHDLADDWIEPHDEHYCTSFTFVFVAPAVPETVRTRVAGLDERTLLKYGFHGHYEVNVVVVAPDERDLVANEAADVEEAFRMWDPIEESTTGILGRLLGRLRS